MYDAVTNVAQETMFEIINSIEIDIALVSGLIALLVANVVTMLGLVKTAGENRR